MYGYCLLSLIQEAFCRIGLRILSILLSASRVGVSIRLGALERALVLSPSERSDIGCRYLDLSESIEFPGNSPGKSHELSCMSTSVASFNSVATL